MLNTHEQTQVRTANKKIEKAKKFACQREIIRL